MNLQALNTNELETYFYATQSIEAATILADQAVDACDAADEIEQENDELLTEIHQLQVDSDNLKWAEGEIIELLDTISDTSAEDYTELLDHVTEKLHELMEQLMCQQCVNNLIDLLPDNMSWNDKVDVLWSHTAFPAGSADTVERQLKEYVANTKTDNQ